MNDQKSINDAVTYLYTHGQKYAEAKAEVTYLEEFRKSKKAMLMKTAMENGCKSVAAAEIEAYADMEYIALLTGIRVAVEKSEGLRWGLISAQARIDVWRSLEASNRSFDKAVS
jgi:hypothetical protein